ncbi:MAG: ABC transporter ATP-binding protein [Cellulosilyticaceae bacterium]
MNDLLEVQGLCKKYEAFELKDVSFNIPAGYIMGFVGVNGAGKTTTLKLILNAIDKNSGSIRVFGKDNIKYEQEIKQDLGVVFDSVFLVKDWTLKEVEKAYKLFYNNWDSKKYYDYLDQFRLLPQMQVKDLSKGMGMKLLLAAALSHDAKLLLLDEPTSGLDPAARDELMELFQEYIEDGTRSIVFSTHVTSDLEKIADFITCIHQGEIYFTGMKEELLEKYCIVKGEPKGYKGCEDKLIGIRKFSTGFEALVLRENLKQLTEKTVIEQLTIDDIIIFMNRGGKKNGR